VERCLEYANLPSEAPEVITKHRPKGGWPSQGAVEFRELSARYRPGLDLVLKDISLSFRPREKIGVVGRTGAGKTSLTMVLFRIIEPASGHVAIDDLNTSSIGLLDLRQRLAIIPQDAALFEGTVRDNLDPEHVRDDTELWSVLGKRSGSSPPPQMWLARLTSKKELARLKDHVSSMPGRLDAKIHEGGMVDARGRLWHPQPRWRTRAKACCRIQPKPRAAAACIDCAGAAHTHKHSSTRRSHGTSNRKSPAISPPAATRRGPLVHGADGSNRPPSTSRQMQCSRRR
jgi:ABC-type Fe3+/spermidine/putrescine transport system ATPase subunit